MSTHGLTDAEHRELRESLGAYLLGALDAAEEADVVAHLRTCAYCPAELLELGEVPPALAVLGPEDIPPVIVRRSAADPRTRVRGEVLLLPAAWGTRVELHVTGLPPVHRCRLVGWFRGGEHDIAASWLSPRDPAEPTAVTGALPVAPADVTHLQVVIAGQTFLSVPVRTDPQLP
jgi:anti-sigma factor RsiW